MQYWLSEGAGSQGTNLVMLTARMAQTIAVEVPPMDTQKKILRLNELWEKEQQLTKALQRNREIMLQGMFQQLLMEKSS